MRLVGDAGLLAQCAWGALTAVVAAHMRSTTRLNHELAAYAAYHQHPINQAIHFVFVPAILYATLLIAAHFPLFGFRGLALASHKLTWASLIAALYAAFYATLDPRLGPVYSLVVVAGYVHAARFVQRERSACPRGARFLAIEGTSGRALRLAFAIQLVSWYAQLHPGHAVFEKVKPALRDSLGQALSVAPLFAFYEGVWALGLEPRLQQQTLAAVAERRAAMCVSEPELSFCAGLGGGRTQEKAGAPARK